MKKLLSILLVLLLLSSVTPFAFAQDEPSGVLRMMGPGRFADNGPDGKVDLISGVELAGYNELIALFNEEYPNVEVQVDAIPWDSWQAKVQTAAAGSQTDIIMHGATVVDVVRDLTPYLESSPEVAEALAAGPAIRRANEEDYTSVIPAGIPYLLTPCYVLLDKQIFEDFGVELPDTDWTFDDFIAIAKATTGANPRTGEQNYGCYNFTGSDSNIWKPYMIYSFAKGVENVEFAVDKFETQFHFTTETGVGVFETLNEIFQCMGVGYLENVGQEKIGYEDNVIAMYMAESPVEINNIIAANGLSDRYAFTSLPVQETGVAATSGFCGDNNFAISKTADRDDLAWLFISWMITSEKAQDWVIRAGSIPSTKAGQDMLSSDLPYYEAVQTLFSSYPKNFFYASTPYWDNSYGTSNSVMCSNLASMYAGTITPEACAQAVQAGIEEYRDLYQ